MLKVYGASDDLIEVEGDICEEFYAIDEGVRILAFSDGTVLSITYDGYGIWRIRRLAMGRATYMLTEAADADSDIATLDGEPIAWAVFGTKIARRCL